MGALMLDGTESTAQLKDEDISTFADAKRRLLARVAQLNDLRARAVKAGNTKLVTTIDADIKEAKGLQAKVASVETLIQPFLNAWEWAKKAVGLGQLAELGLIWVPVAITGGIAAAVYAINVFDRKMETAGDRYEAELKAVNEWKAQGLTTEAAVAQVNKTGAQIAKKDEAEAAKPGLFDNVSSLAKLGGALLLAGAAWKAYEHFSQKKGRTAAA